MNTIEVTNLKRTYTTTIGVFRRKVKNVVALDGISFAVADGELFGLVGPNGAGKTTTVKILTTLLAPTAGQVHILGYDMERHVDQIRPRIGFVFGGERGLYWRLSGSDNLTYFANLYHIPPAVQKKRIPALLKAVGLDGRGEEKVQGYSRGMKQRLHIARALLHDPAVLILDEPTMGLDPVGARELRQIIRNLQGQTKTILLGRPSLARQFKRRPLAVGRLRQLGLFDRAACALRAFFNIFDGALTVAICFAWGVVLGLDLSRANLPAIALTILVVVISTSGLGFLVGSLGLMTPNVLFVLNVILFMLLIFTGADIPLNKLDPWMQAVSGALPLTRAIQSARLLVSGANLGDVLPLLGGELLVGIVYALAGFAVFRWFEWQARARGTLEAM